MKNVHGSSSSFVLVLLVLLLLAGLPIAVWLDLSNLADANLRRQAADLNSLVSSVRAYYGVNCHNSHPESPKRDWKVGDVRGIQEVAIAQTIGTNILAFKYLLAYFVLIATVGTIFIALQRRQTAVINGMNVELETANEFLA